MTRRAWLYGYLYRGKIVVFVRRAK